MEELPDSKIWVNTKDSKRFNHTPNRMAIFYELVWGKFEPPPPSDWQLRFMQRRQLISWLASWRQDPKKKKERPRCLAAASCALWCQVSAMSQDARLTPAELAAKKAKQAEVGPEGTLIQAMVFAIWVFLTILNVWLTLRRVRTQQWLRRRIGAA